MRPTPVRPTLVGMRYVRTVPVVFVVSGVLLASPLAARAATTTLYVDKTDPGCSDSGPGTASAPYCTVVKGVGKLSAGATLYIGDGTYAETIKPAVSGTAAEPITITAWPGRHPVLNPASFGVNISSRSYVVLSGLTFSGTKYDGVYVSNSTNITVTGNSVTGAGRQVSGQTAPGISVRGSTASAVSGNIVDRNNGTGILVTSGSTDILVDGNSAGFNAEGFRRNANGINVVSPGNTVLRNITHDNEDSGIQFYTGGDNGLAALNVTYNNGDHGIDDLNVTGGRLIGNTVYRNCTTGINVEGTSGNYQVLNNVAVDNAVYPAYQGIACGRRAGNIGIWDSAPSTTTVDHNLVWLTTSGTMYVFGSSYSSLAAMKAATGQEASGKQADPRFANAAGWDLRLTASSPAIDTANSGVSGEQLTDVLGNGRVDDLAVPNTGTGPRGYDDLGGYEYQPSGTSQPPVAAVSVTPSSGTVPLAVTADGSGSSDPQGQALTYTFDFGEGTVVGPQSAATASHTYGATGTFTVTLTVRDTGGLTGTAQGSVSVSAAAQPPVAALSVSPSSGTAPLPVTADGSGSSDPQGQVLTYTFDFGDGTVVGPQSAATASHTYGATGTFTVTLTVRDTSNLVSTAQRSVTVTSGGGGGTPAVYVNQIATNYSTSVHTSGSVQVWRTGG